MNQLRDYHRNAGADNVSSQVESIVRNRLCGRVHGLRVMLHDGGVVIRGRSKTFYAKQLAQHAVMDATNRPIVANLIEVM